MLTASLVASTVVLTSGCQVSSFAYSAPVIHRRVVPLVQSYSYAAPAAYVAPVAKTIVFYGVGQNLQLQSLVKQQLRTDSQYQEFLQWKSQRQQQAQQPPAQPHDGYSMPPATTPPQDPPPPPADPETLPPPPQPRAGGVAPQVNVANTCARCHGTATPAGNYYLDGATPMDDISKPVRMIMSGAMPPAVNPDTGEPIPGYHALTPVERYQLIEDLTRLNTPQEDT